MTIKYFIFLFGLSLLISCSRGNNAEQLSGNMVIEDAILRDQDSFYYIDFAHYPQQEETLPIGVFDSGTGGLTVLNTIVEYDRHNNEDYSSGSDKLPDFKREKFIYLADQANMPYGNYSSENKTDLLVEHVLKDAQFLLSDRYYMNEASTVFRTDKERVKALVIACNTATAYGKKHIEEFIKKTGIQLKVIGVIDAGARGVLKVFKKEESGSIGVFATVGTIASNGYGKTIESLIKEMGYTGDIQIFNQGGHGLAEAVDEEPDFIARNLKEPRENYRGPALDNPEHQIDKALLNVYDFRFDHNQMLCDAKSSGDCEVLQINSAENYVRYHLVSLLEKMRKSPGAKPLKAIVLGCTHYPYLSTEIKIFLDDLYNYQKNGKYIYRHLLEEDVDIIDPSVTVAAELYDFLKQQDLFNPAGNMDSSEFYISIPNTTNANIETDNSGRFTYEYKYGRDAGNIQEYVKIVPFNMNNIPAETIGRFMSSLPETYKLMNTLNNEKPLVQE